MTIHEQTLNPSTWSPSLGFDHSTITFVFSRLVTKASPSSVMKSLLTEPNQITSTNRITSYTELLATVFTRPATKTLCASFFLNSSDHTQSRSSLTTKSNATSSSHLLTYHLDLSDHLELLFKLIIMPPSRPMSIHNVLFSGLAGPWGFAQDQSATCSCREVSVYRFMPIHVHWGLSPM